MWKRAGNRSPEVMNRASLLGLAVLCGSLLAVTLLLAMRAGSLIANADPISPPAGRPKLGLSLKTVTPTLTSVGGGTLRYAIEIRNTGAFTASRATLADTVPDGAVYNLDAEASSGAVAFSDQTLTWEGDVGFDSTVIVSFSVNVSSLVSGVVRNTAVISHPLIAVPITVTADTIVTDFPVLSIGKTSTPPKPGANKPLTYILVVVNQGQPARNVPITATDRVPPDTTLRQAGIDGTDDGTTITWTRRITLDLGETTAFTFSVDIGDVLSGTVIANDEYWVASPQGGMTPGDPYTVTVVDPIFYLSKRVWPDPPGSNREMTYTLALHNGGSLATNLVITDRVPAGVSYQRGGTHIGGVVSWTLSSLGTDESAYFTYTVYITDVADLTIANRTYEACSAEGVCRPGRPLSSVVRGPTFEASAELDPIAKGPGGGTKPVTPTLVVRNLGPGNALSATAILYFYHISVQGSDLYATPSVGSLSDPQDCSDGELKCVSFVWRGDLDHGKAITFTTLEGQSTIQPVPYTATVVITDSLANLTTSPVTGTARGEVMHIANLVPTKSASPVIGRGNLLTYTIHIWNSGLSADGLPWLRDTVPPSTTLVYVSDGGVSQTLTESTTISWTLPAMSTGENTSRSFAVRVDSDLVSGTQIINQGYTAYWVNSGVVYSNTGQPITTTVKDVGLIDSFKEVTPTVVTPGPGKILTYSIHIVNSGPLPLVGVTVYDLLPWEPSTYLRDAVASAGQVISDIVSVRWSGDVAAFSTEVVTLSVLVDSFYRGAITNTAIISHPDLLSDVEVQAVAYVTEQPVLRIAKSATPDLVDKGAELAYTIRVGNLGQQASNVTVTDTVPANATYVLGSATEGGMLVGDQVHWIIPSLDTGESRSLGFRVTVLGGSRVVNDRYAVSCLEGVRSTGAPVVTRVSTDQGTVYLPMVCRNAQ